MEELEGQKAFVNLKSNYPPCASDLLKWANSKGNRRIIIVCPPSASFSSSSCQCLSLSLSSHFNINNRIRQPRAKQLILKDTEQAKASKVKRQFHCLLLSSGQTTTKTTIYARSFQSTLNTKEWKDRTLVDKHVCLSLIPPAAMSSLVKTRL